MSEYKPEYWLSTVRGFADKLNPTLYKIRKLKPNNARAIKNGEKQLYRYLKGAKKEIKETCWELYLDLYKAPEIIKQIKKNRMRGENGF